MDARAFRKSLPLASCYLGKCTPDIETIFEEELLDGRTFEAGGHGMFWGNNSRVSCVMKHLGEFVNLPLNEGLGFIEWQGEGEDGKGKAGKAHQVHKAKPYQWMSDEGYQKTMEQLYEMSRTSFEDMAGLMTTSLQDWLESRDLHPEAYDYLKVLAAAQTAQAEPAMTPAGDYLGYMAIAGRIGMNLVVGSVASCDEPGTIAIPQAMEHACVENGGEVRRSANVREVLIEDGKVTGLYLQIAVMKSSRLKPTTSCAPFRRNTSSRFCLKINSLPNGSSLLKEEFWGAGLLTGWVGTKKSFMEDIGLDPRSFVFMPGVIRDEGYIGCVDMVMCNFTAWDDQTAKRGPEGKHEYLFSTALTDEEMRDPDKVNRVIELCENWARATFPDWDENVEFIIWTPGPEAYGLWRPIGEKRPPTQSPWVEGLYFAGDQYGERLWGGGIDGAALSGVLCVDKMMETNLEEEIFPPFHRGIPKVAA